MHPTLEPSLPAVRFAEGAVVEPPIVEIDSKRVVTLAMMDKLHQRPEGTAGRNFREHKGRLLNGEDYFEISSDEIRRINPEAIPAASRREVTLLTESGYLMVVKSFTDDLAWQVQRQLVKGYFRARDVAQPTIPDLSNPVVLLALLTEQAQGHIADQRRAVEAETKAAVAQGSLDRLGSTKGAVPLRDAGKTLGLAKCDDIFEKMETIGWIYRREPKGRWIAHADKQRAGYLDHRPHTYTDKSGEPKTVSQVVVTPKGLVKLAELFTKTILH